MERKLKIWKQLGTFALLAGAAVSARAEVVEKLVVTASNAAANQLLVYDVKGNLMHTIATGGKGGVSGNAGGIAVWKNHVAVVNFGSQTVSLFEADGNSLALTSTIIASSSPVSVAFGNDHMYILGTTKVESHAISEFGVHPGPDGIALLVKADGSAAQVGVVQNQLIITEKNNAIESVPLSSEGAVNGSAELVQNIPSNVNAPFGLATRGNDAYVTIAHADEISLVRNDDVLTVTGSGTQHAPCWVALDGPFLFSANSPSHSISRYAVYGQKIVQDAAVVATFNGAPTDIAYRAGLVAVIDGEASSSRITIFSTDEDGNLTEQGTNTMLSGANGVGIIASEK
jgi:hypothetical protein